MPSPMQVPRGRLGPALRRRRLPMAALTVSAVVHVILAGGLLAAVIWGGWNARKVYVVNLVPSISAVGAPTAAPSRPAVVPPPRVPEPTPPPRETRPPEPAKAPSLPETAPSRAALPPRAPALPRPGEKELPPLAPPTLPSERRPLPPAAPRTAETPSEARPAPPPPAPPPGQVTGSPTGTGVRTLVASDFPHAWYLRQVLAKVEREWQKQAQMAELPDKPLVMVEIQRDGSIGMPKIEKSSGNAFYDQAALRAIMDARPFAPLPTEWSRPSLRVMFSFDFKPERG
jgi:TonB family protein